MHSLHAHHMLLPDGWARDVRLDVDEAGIIRQLTRDAAPGDSHRLPGPTLPGMVNAHSHAFQHLIAGFTDTAEHPDDSFWSWREAMYRAVTRLEADDFEAVFRHVFAAMLRAGYTTVTEFHYVHHDRDGHPYARRAELAERAIKAAAEVGIGLTLLPVLYAHGGFGGQAPSAGQRRFINDVDGFLALHEQATVSTRGQPLAHMGAAVHSLRAVTPAQLEAVLAGLPEAGPRHIHVAEQTGEVEACLEWSGRRPVEWLLEHAPVGPEWCLIHATHLSDEELRGLLAADPVAGLCPTTEANLGDGLFRGEEWLAGGGALAIGSDSNVSLSVVEELRWLEYGQRLASRRRNRLARPGQPAVGEALYTAAAEGGARASGQPVGGIEAGRRADLVVLDDHDPLLAECPDGQRLNRWLFAAGDRAIHEVWVAGKRRIESGHHALDATIAPEFRRVCRDLIYS